MATSNDPKWMVTANSLIGTKEIPGPANNPKILGWAQKVGSFLGMKYDADSIAWCGLFVSYCMKETGINPPQISVRAKSWATWGQPLKDAAFGAVAVFSREGGGHVGFIVAQDDSTYHVLGGNQSDMVCVTRIAKNRCIALRWPTGLTLPEKLAPKVDAKGEISKNEA